MSLLWSSIVACMVRSTVYEEPDANQYCQRSPGEYGVKPVNIDMSGVLAPKLTPKPVLTNHCLLVYWYRNLSPASFFHTGASLYVLFCSMNVVMVSPCASAASPDDEIVIFVTGEAAM